MSLIWHVSRSSRSYSYHAVTTRSPRSPERFSSAISIFPQVLEGPRAEVERLYETLNHDPRHKDLLLLLSEPLGARQFPDWSMAYIGPNQWAKQAAGPPSGGPAGARRLLALMGQTLNRG